MVDGSPRTTGAQSLRPEPWRRAAILALVVFMLGALFVLMGDPRSAIRTTLAAPAARAHEAPREGAELAPLPARGPGRAPREDDARATATQAPLPAPEAAEPEAPEARSGPTAALTLEVVEGVDRTPVAGARVHVSRAKQQWLRPVTRESDEHGLATFEELAPGPWAYFVQPAGSEHNVRGDVTLEPGDALRLQVQLDDDEIALAVAGTFLDEDGAPLEVGREDHPQLWVGASLADFGIATGPSADGTFRIYLPRSREVVVRNFGGHRYEPELTRVPFGTTGLVLRRVERFPARDLLIEVRDAADDALVPAAHLTVYRGDARTANGMTLVKRPSEGRLAARIVERPGTCLAVWASGYAPRFLDLPPANAAPTMSEHQELDTALSVRLERGGLRELYVHDAAHDRPLAGVDVLGPDGARLAVTDARGRVDVRSDLEHWLTLRAAGYLDERFHPTWPWDVAHLARR